MKNLKIGASALLTAGTMLFTMTGCAQSSKENQENYDTSEYAIVFVDETPHLVKAQVQGNMYEQLMAYCGIVDDAAWVDVNSEEEIARTSRFYELNEEAEFSNEKGAIATRYAIILLDDLVNGKSFSSETYDFFANNPEDVCDYVAEKYLYNVVERVEYNEKEYTTELGIYEFENGLNGDTNYHIGYNANRIYDCDYIYDINDNKIYRKPDIGTYTFTPIKDLYDKKQITANKASELADEYANGKSESNSYVKKIH